jgi:hypothetical protein
VPISLSQREQWKIIEKEGVKIKNDMVVNFKELFWDPGKELI